MTFDDVISQKHITDTLRNQVISGRTAHAYLFTGARGTGKTTCARILAKAVNCENVKDGNPCLECGLCRDADSGALTDIIEIDAASNNGVDDIRELREGAVYIPERGKYKVYIIDEVHMLSSSAFNALLKIMEEPPPFVKFILATTEVHKVPATIVSRCQRFDFRRIKPGDIAERLLYIASEEDIKLTEDGALLIARIADGGMRDAVSLLDRCSACNEVIDSAAVSAAAGIADRGNLYEILESIASHDASGAIKTAGALYDMSKDLARLCDELIGQIRNIMLIKASPENAETLVVCMPDEKERLEKIAAGNSLDTIMNWLSLLQRCRERMLSVVNKRVEFEMTLIKLCEKPEVAAASIDKSGIYDKIEQLESRIRKLESRPLPGSYPAGKPELTKENSPAADTEPVPDVDLRKIDLSKIPDLDRWGEVLEQFQKDNPAVSASLKNSTAKVAGNVIFITVQTKLFMQLFRKKENAVSLGDTLYKVLGKRFAIKARCEIPSGQTESAAQRAVQKAKDSGIPTAVENNKGELK